MRNRPKLRSLAIGVLSASAIIGLASSCTTTQEPSTTPIDLTEPVATETLENFAPAPPTLARLTQRQYRNTIGDLFGEDIVAPASLEQDLPSAGLQAVGATTNSVSPRGVEQYFEGAKSLAAQLFETTARRDAIVSCTPSGTADTACMAEVLSTWGRRLWRRPLTTTEVDAVVALAAQAAGALESFDRGLEYGFIALLSSPHFLYRVEVGQSDGDARFLTPFEFATRLSFFLWNSTPDDALLEAAEDGRLDTEEGRLEQIDRLMADPRNREATRNFVAEWLHLYELDEMGKDPFVFKHFSPELGASAREETLRLAEHVIYALDADFRTFFTSRTTFVDRRLAAIYNIPAPAEEGFAQVELPSDGARAGFLGQVSFLGLHAHPVSSSATLRGVFIRKTLLCQAVPSPPAGLNTAIPEPSEDAKTLRERLLVHMEDPSCGACHGFIDPPGFGLEQFDGIGRYRVEDNGAPIDPTGELDGDPFETPVELMELIANHAGLTQCVVKQLYSYATGHSPVSGEYALLDALDERFAAGGFRFQQLMRDVATSPGFRTVAPVETSTDATGGQ